jgi:hypothetical protein
VRRSVTQRLLPGSFWFFGRHTHLSTID